MNDQEKAADERIARLYRDAAHEEPPARLDSAIHRAARASGRPQPSRAQSRWNSWRLPFTFAAIGIVSVSLVTLVLDESGERPTHVPQEPASADAHTPAQPEAQPPLARSVPGASAPVEAQETASAAERGSAAAAKPSAPKATARRMEEADRFPAPLAGEIAKLETQPPAAWLERILWLRTHGQEAEADALLAEFKTRFPGAALPAQLQ